MFAWIYNLSTHEFLRGGPCEQPFDNTTEGLVKLLRHPTPFLERYDGVGDIRPATGQEMSNYDAVMVLQRTGEDFDDQKLVKALGLWTAQKLGVPLATAKAEILVIYRGL